jgi:membrane protease YdiL (CAAX protease family)
MSLSPGNLPQESPPRQQEEEQEQSQPPATQQPQPSFRRIPNIGHALLFVAFAGLLLLLSELLLIVIWGPPAAIHGGVVEVLHPKLQLASEGATYALTLLMAWLLFPRLWHRAFLPGLKWNWSAARKQAGQLVLLGLLLGIMSGLVDHFISSSKPPPIDQFFIKASDAWIITFFGVLVAPLFEEICFRGFLVPAIAITYDWLSLSRTEEARARWQSTSTLTPAALLCSAVISSLLFALLHGQQVAFSRGAMVVLFSISLVLTFVRVKTQSVAASTLVHGAYNGFIFLTMILATGGYRHLDRLTR